MEEPRWLRRQETDLFQQRSIERFGGRQGVRDSGLIDSALSRPAQRWNYDSTCDLRDLAASYAYGLAKNHGYVDGNKRIAFIAMGVFLYLNGLFLEAPDEEAVAVMVGLASGERGESELAAWIRARVVSR